MTKTFNTAESLRAWFSTMGIKETVWEGFQILTKQGPMMRTVASEGLTMELRIEQAFGRYLVTVDFHG